MALDKNDLAQIEEISVRTIMAALNEIMLPRFEDYDRHFGKLNTKLEDHDSQFEKLGSEMQDMEAEMRAGFAAVNRLLGCRDKWFIRESGC